MSRLPLPRGRWNMLQIALHWITVLLIIALAIIGLSMTDMPLSPDKVRAYALHKSLGLTVLALTLLRLLWRWHADTPGPLALPQWQHRLSRISHTLLYVLLLAMPLSGWLYNSASNFALQWFGLFNVPALVERSDDIKSIAHLLHVSLFWTLMVVVFIHAAAALWHHFADRDDTLRRMLPWHSAAPESTAVNSEANQP